MKDNDDTIDQNLGYWFWKRVDNLRGKKQLKEIADSAHIDYTRIKNQRSDNRLPKLEDAYKLSRAINCSISYLISGIDTEDQVPSNLQPILHALKIASDEDLSLIRRVLRIPDPAEPSRKQA